MALVKCPECGKEISDKASSCTNCGCPASEFKKPSVPEDTRSDWIGLRMRYFGMHLSISWDALNIYQKILGYRFARHVK